MPRLETLTSDYKIDQLHEAKYKRLNALKICNDFLASAVIEAAKGDSISLFGKMRNAGELIPSEFESLDNIAEIKSPERRLQPYVRSQLFIALTAEVEDFLNQLLYIVLKGYPNKMTKQQIPLSDIIGKREVGEIISLAIEKHLTKLFYSKPHEYRKEIEEILSIDSSELDEVWPRFIEMKARRDLGVHGDWKKNKIYISKLKEARIDVPQNTFLGISNTYFINSLGNALSMLEILCEHSKRRFNIIFSQ